MSYSLNNEAAILYSCQTVPDSEQPQQSAVSAVTPMSKIKLQRQVHKESKEINEKFVSLRMSVERYLHMSNYDVKELLICIMDIKYVKSAIEDLQTATSARDVFFTLLKRNMISFVQFSIIKRVVTKLCLESVDLQEQLQQYEADFNKYIMRRVCESSLYHKGKFELFTGGDSNGDVELLIVTDDNWNEYTSFVDVLDLGDIVAKSLNIDNFSLHLARIETNCLRIRYTISVHIVNNVFPLTIEEWNKLTEHGIVEMKCLDFHYSQKEKCNKIMHDSCMRFRLISYF